MKSILKRLWSFCQTPQPTQVRLTVETLEDRLVPSVAAGPHGETYSTWGASHTLYQRDAAGNWTSLQATGITSVAAGADGTLITVSSDSSFKEYNPATGGWSVVDTNVGTATVGPQGQLYYTHGLNEQLWERDSAAATPFVFTDKTGIKSLSAGADGAVDAVFADGSVQQLVGGISGQWTTLWGSGMSAVAAGPHGETYVIWGSSDSLNEYTSAGGWQYLHADNVAALSVGVDGTLDAIFTGNGANWQWDATTGTWDASAVFSGASTDPAGATLEQALIQYGLDHLGQPTADPGLLFTCADFVAAALHATGGHSNEDFGITGMDESLDYVWGVRAIQHNAGDPLSDLDQVQPGDILQFRNVASTVTSNQNGSSFTGSWSFPQHTAIVYQNLGNGRLSLLEQNFNEQQIVTLDTIDLSGMTSGTLWVYQPIAK